jgi:hypothetical protein
MMVFFNSITLKNLSLTNVLKLFVVSTFPNLLTMKKKTLFLRIDGYVCLLNVCTMEAREKWKKRHQEENYLAHLSFADELQCSFNGFIAIVISTFVRL